MANNDNINDLISSHSPQDELLKLTRKLVEKWEPTGLLEGINSETEVSSMSVPLSKQDSLPFLRGCEKICYKR